MADAPNDIDEIRRQMAQIRRELHEDVQEVVAGAEAVADWRRFIRMYPWAAVGVAVAAGYLVVPKRRRSVPRDVARQADLAEVREAIEEARGPDKKKRRKSLIAAGFGMLAPLAWRAVQNYAMGYLEQWIARKQQEYMAAAGPPPGAAESTTPGRPSWPGGPGRPGGPRGT